MLEKDFLGEDMPKKRYVAIGMLMVVLLVVGGYVRRHNQNVLVSYLKGTLWFQYQKALLFYDENGQFPVSLGESSGLKERHLFPFENEIFADRELEILSVRSKKGIIFYTSRALNGKFYVVYGSNDRNCRRESWSREELTGFLKEQAGYELKIGD